MLCLDATHLLVGKGDDREGLVELPQGNVADSQIRLLQRL